MLYLVLALIILGLFTALLGFISSRRGESDEPEGPHKPTCSSCTGSDPTCEQTCMMEAATKEIVYYDDEELDIFKGRPADSYNEEEVEQFSEVLYTLRPEDVKGWNRSLILRGINIPNQLKDELVMMIEG